MNFSLLEHIDKADRGILATILHTEGHTYKKRGEKALFALDDPFPVLGNLGSLCVDQEIVLRGREAYEEGMPKVITVDTSDTTDIHFGYGTFCGGKMTILLEPITAAYKNVCKTVRDYLQANRPFHLIHDLQTGEVSLSESAPTGDDRFFTESVPSRADLFIFGATPLAHRLVTDLEELEFRIHVIDWRSDYLDRFVDVATILAGKEPLPFDEKSLVLIVSHSFERDRDVLKQALLRKCAFLGLLSSKIRRDQMFEDLLKEGITEDDICRVSSPLGLDIGGRSDVEIAISITAELVRFKNQ
jgi:xanthine dehydrogenase accessory factor